MLNAQLKCLKFCTSKDGSAISNRKAMTSSLKTEMFSSRKRRFWSLEPNTICNCSATTKNGLLLELSKAVRQLLSDFYCALPRQWNNSPMRIRSVPRQKTGHICGILGKLKRHFITPRHNNDGLWVCLNKCRNVSLPQYWSCWMFFFISADLYIEKWLSWASPSNIERTKISVLVSVCLQHLRFRPPNILNLGSKCSNYRCQNLKFGILLTILKKFISVS